MTLAMVSRTEVLERIAEEAYAALVAKHGARSLRDYPQTCPVFLAWSAAERALDDQTRDPNATLGQLCRSAFGSDRNVNAIYDSLYR